MSTHRRRKSASIAQPASWSLSIFHSGLFLAGVVAGAAFLIKSMRLQAELQSDALVLVREEHDRLSQQVDGLSQKIDQLSVAVGELSPEKSGLVPAVPVSQDEASINGSPTPKPSRKKTQAANGVAGAPQRAKARARRSTKTPVAPENGAGTSPEAASSEA